MPRDRIIYKELYHAGRFRMSDHESLTALQKIPHFNGRVMIADVLAVAKVDRAGTKLEYIDLRVWIAPYSDPPPARENPNDPDRGYVCPQCGPDPAGSEEHARKFHTVEGLLGANNENHSS